MSQDTKAILQVAVNYLLTFLAGWATGILSDLPMMKAVATGMVALGANAAGLHQSKPKMEIK